MDLRQLELLQHCRVQDSKDTNCVVFAANVDSNGRRVTFQEGWILEMLVCRFGYLERDWPTIDFFNPIALELVVLQAILPRDEG